MPTREEQESLIWKFLQDKLDIHSRNALYIEAFTHDLGDVPESKGNTNERLAYLGDMIVNFTLANRAFIDYPKLKSGKLTEKCKGPRSNKSLAEAFEDMGLSNDYIIKPENQQIKGRQKVRAKIIEALFGAIFLDQGFCVARFLAEKHLPPPDKN